MRISRRSMWGLNAANFFLAKVVSLFLPFLSILLKSDHWTYNHIGSATAISGLGSLLFQTPAGILSDRIHSRRELLAASSLGLGLIFLAMPFVVDRTLITYLLMFLFGTVGTFIVPLLSALAKALVENRELDMLIGINHSWNHFGGLVGALTSVFLMGYFGIKSIFYFIFLGSILAAVSLFMIRKNELHEDLPEEDRSLSRRSPKGSIGVWFFLSNAPVRMLITAVVFFQIANAPLIPLVGLYLKHLGGDNRLVAWAVLTATVGMVPAAWISGKSCSIYGRKWVLMIGLIFLPIQISLCCITIHPILLILIQALNGISAGVFGVVTVLICGDLTWGKQGFSTLLGLVQTAIALGGVFGPLVQGFMTEHYGFVPAFIGQMGFSLFACILFFFGVPETKIS